MSYGLTDLALDALKLKVAVVPADLQAKRYEICKQCPSFNQNTRKCRLCGCFMPVKTKLTRATCPDKKW